MVTDYQVSDDGDGYQVAFMMGNRQVAGMILPFQDDGPTPDELHDLAILFGEVFKQVKTSPR